MLNGTVAEFQVCFWSCCVTKLTLVRPVFDDHNDIVDKPVPRGLSSLTIHHVDSITSLGRGNSQSRC